MLAFLYGLGWWVIPVTIIVQFYIAEALGSPDAVAWMVTSYVAGASIGYLVAGGLSDLFGRRITMQVGSFGLAVGLMISNSAKSGAQFLGGIAIAGFFAGICFMALACIPYGNPYCTTLMLLMNLVLTSLAVNRELIPLRIRHIGLCIADSVGFVTTVVGPVAGRYATLSGGNTWIWLYWSDVILCLISFALITWLYKVSPLL